MALRIVLVVSLAVSVTALNRGAKVDNTRQNVGPGTFIPPQLKFAQGAKASEFVQKTGSQQEASAHQVEESIHDEVTKINRQMKIAKNTISSESKKVLDGLGKLRAYKFDDYVRDYARPYSPGTAEWSERERHFQKNLNLIVAHNSGAPRQSWSASINKFMDFAPEEARRMLGYKKEMKHKMASSLLQSTFEADEDLVIPASHTWQPTLNLVRGTTSYFRDQGSCGSCWATAAIQVLEDHLTIATNKTVQLSAQQMVSCTPNLNECGGSGGCNGATAELAFKYLVDNGGIAAEQTWAYTSGSGADGSCNKEQHKHVTIAGFNTLPINQYWPLMQALYQAGPVVISVDASNWFMYDQGVFSGCAKDAVVNHAVVCLGYGEDNDLSGSGVTKYFKVKNSWGEDWGEEGYIRLLRQDGGAVYPNEPADEFMQRGTDHDPASGNGCKTGPNAMAASNPTMAVAGMCGMFSDSVYPLDTQFLAVADGGTYIAGQQAPSVLSLKQKLDRVREMKFNQRNVMPFR